MNLELNHFLSDFFYQFEHKCLKLILLTGVKNFTCPIRDEAGNGIIFI